MASSDTTPEKPSPARPPVGLSFGDGFQFGCGFMLAGLIAVVLVVLVALLILLLLSLMGVGLIGNLLGSGMLPVPLA